LIREHMPTWSNLRSAYNLFSGGHSFFF
jgi:hypothetical protein